MEEAGESRGEKRREEKRREERRAKAPAATGERSNECGSKTRETKLTDRRRG
jgi:hypothetical protein